MARHTHRPETVTIPRTEYHRLLHLALIMETLDSSPHVAELIAEYLEWNERRILRETSGAICAALDWQAAAHVPTYAELERRRRITSVADCGRCGAAVELVHPLQPWQFDRLPDMSWVRCQRCTAVRGVAA